MQVTDIQNLAQMTSIADTSMKHLDTAKELYEKTTEYIDITKQMSQNIGQAISLGNSAVQWIKTDGKEAKECLIPKISQFVPTIGIKTRGLCDTQDFIRKELGIPTTQDLENTINQGQNNLEDWGIYDWKKGIRYNSEGEAIINLPKKVIRQKIKKRQQFANDSRQAAVAVSYSYLNDQNQKLFDNLETLSSNLSRKPQTTNELLLQLNNNILSLYKAILYQNALIASSIQMQAGDSLEASGLIINQGGNDYE